MLIHSAYTHSGEFHPDDIMSAALLSLIFPGIEFARTCDQEELKTAMASQEHIVFDVGGEYSPRLWNFDSKGASITRPNGVRYSSFGLLWKVFGYEYCKSAISCFGLNIDPAKLVESVDIEFVQGIDIISVNSLDNPRFRPMIRKTKIKITTFGLAIFKQNPQPLLYDQPDYDGAFKDAVQMAVNFLERIIESCLAKLYGHKLIHEGRQINDRIVVVHKTIPDWSDVVNVEFPETLYYIDPDTSDPTGQAYTIWQVPTEPNGLSSRKPLPEAWADKRGADLETVTGIAGSNFCHRFRFVGGGKTLEATLAMARAAIAAK